jgi:hypothetical protein
MTRDAACPGALVLTTPVRGCWDRPRCPGRLLPRAPRGAAPGAARLAGFEGVPSVGAHWPAGLPTVGRLRQGAGCGTSLAPAPPVPHSRVRGAAQLSPCCRVANAGRGGTMRPRSDIPAAGAASYMNWRIVAAMLIWKARRRGVRRALACLPRTTWGPPSPPARRHGYGEGGLRCRCLRLVLAGFGWKRATIADECRSMPRAGNRAIHLLLWTMANQRADEEPIVGLNQTLAPSPKVVIHHHSPFFPYYRTIWISAHSSVYSDTLGKIHYDTSDAT